MTLILKPVMATVEIMKDLERQGIIRRICPGKDVLAVERGQSRWTEIYSAQDRFGPHKLIAVTINSTEPVNFSYHSDPEDFMLIDRPADADLILTIALSNHEALAEKIAAGTLSAADFICLCCKANDPELSFFTMNPFYAHVETCSAESDNPPSFYVGESKNLDENRVDFGGYRIAIQM